KPGAQLFARCELVGGCTGNSSDLTLRGTRGRKAKHLGFLQPISRRQRKGPSAMETRTGVRCLRKEILIRAKCQLPPMPNRDDDVSRAESAAEFLLSQVTLRPQIALILGSGLGSFADELAEAVRIPYIAIPHFPRSTAIGHAGQMVIGQVE